MSKIENMGEDPAYVRNLDSVVKASQEFVKISCTHGCPDHMPAKLTMAIACLTGPIAAVAIMSAKGDTVTPESIMFAAILAAKATAPAGADHLSLTFSPEIIMEAVEAFEKLTGQKADEVVCEGMMGAVRHVQEQGAIPLQTFLDAARRSKMN
jgi:hypothetical protein